MFPSKSIFTYIISFQILVILAGEREYADIFTANTGSQLGPSHEVCEMYVTHNIFSRNITPTANST